MNVSLPFISNFPSFINTYMAPAFSADINGTPFALEGKTKPFSDSLETYFDIDIDRLFLPEYVAYVPVLLNFRLTSAYLSTGLRISHVQAAKEKPSLNIKGTLDIDELEIDGLNKGPLIKIPEIDINI